MTTANRLPFFSVRRTARARGLGALLAGVAGLVVSCGDGGVPSADLLGAAGGRDALATIESLGFSAEVSNHTGFQSPTPEGTRPLSTSVVEFRFERDRYRIDYVRDTVYPISAPYDFTHFLDDFGGYVEGAEGVPAVFPSGVMPTGKWAATVRWHRLLTPTLVLAEVARGEIGTSQTGFTEIDGRRYAGILVESAVPIEMFIDLDTGDIRRARTSVHDPLLCDVVLELQYERWTTAASGARVPLHVTAFLRSGLPIHEESRSNLVINEPYGDLLRAPRGQLSVPDEVVAAEGRHQLLWHNVSSAAGAPFPLPQDEITAEELAPGVWFLIASHNSVLVEQQNGLVLIEAPLDRGRSKGILRWTADRFPDKPITHLVVTHHHSDHAGGVRQFVANGSTLVVAEIFRTFFQDDVPAASCNLLPDDQQRLGRTAVTAPVPMEGVHRLDDAVRPIEVHQLRAPHAADMLVVYLPEQRILFNSDMYGPLLSLFGAQSAPEDMVALAELAEARGLDFEVIVGGHGFSDARAGFEAELATLAAVPSQMHRSGPGHASH